MLSGNSEWSKSIKDSAIKIQVSVNAKINWIDQPYLIANANTTSGESDQSNNESTNSDDGSLKTHVAESEKEKIIQALKECDGNRTHTAKVLGISRRTTPVVCRTGICRR